MSYDLSENGGASATPSEASNNLADLQEVHSDKREGMFMKKLEQCYFNNDMGSSDDKLSVLKDLTAYVTDKNNVNSESMSLKVIEMFRHNVQGLAKNNCLGGKAPVHVQEVYEFFLGFLRNTNVKSMEAMKAHINKDLVLELLDSDLFRSENDLERTVLRDIVHQIAFDFTHLRSHIRSSIKNIFVQFTNGERSVNGIRELLAIMASVIEGFSIPLKDEHKPLLTQTLMPLHKAKGLSMYHPELMICIGHFLEKDESLASEVFTCLLKYWPEPNAEVEIFKEVGLIIPSMNEQGFKEIREPLIRKLADAIESPCDGITWDALRIFESEVFFSFIYDERQDIARIIASPLKSKAAKKEEENSEIVGVAQKILDCLEDCQTDTDDLGHAQNNASGSRTVS